MELEQDYESDGRVQALPQGQNDDYSGNVSDALNQHSALLKELMSFDETTKSLFEGWLAIIWDSSANGGKGDYVRNPYAEPIMNSRCASRLINKLSGVYLKRNNFMSYLDEKHFNYIMFDLIWDIFPDLCCNAEKYGIRSDADIRSVLTDFITNVKLVLFSASEGRGLDSVNKTTSVQESIQHNPYGIYGSQGGGFPPAKRTLGDRFKDFIGIGGKK